MERRNEGGLFRKEQGQLHSNTNFPSCDCAVGDAHPPYLLAALSFFFNSYEKSQ